MRFTISSLLQKGLSSLARDQLFRGSVIKPPKSVGVIQGWAQKPSDGAPPPCSRSAFLAGMWRWQGCGGGRYVGETRGEVKTQTPSPISIENRFMGGPCLLESGARAPACTDNFQVARFKFDGKEWESCEQCYQVSFQPMLFDQNFILGFQACKSLGPTYSEAIRSIKKKPVKTLLQTSKR